MRKKQNIELPAGDYKQVLLTVLGNEDQLYPNLEAGLLEWKLFKPPDYETPIRYKSSAGSDITVPSTGNVLLVFNGGDTADLDAGKYYHKLTFTTTDGATKTRTAATGIFTILNRGSEYFRS